MYPTLLRAESAHTLIDPVPPAPSTPPAPERSRNRDALALLLTLTLAGCGGGGGGGSSTSSPSAAAPPPSTTAPAPAPITEADAARLADQATFGATPDVVNAIVAQGAQGWIASQIAMTPTGYPVLSVPPSSSAVGCPTGSPSNCYRDNYTVFPVQRVFLSNAISAPDQLRQRVAFALSQIFVVSGLEVGPAYAMREYQQMLTLDAFGNFRNLLNDVTLSPVMGTYLNMANNNKANGAQKANENYGREVMQLFTIGPNLLNADGSLVLSGGNPVPTYTQDVVDGMSAALTGWTYPPTPGGAASKWTNPQYYIGQMVAFDNHHDTTAKTLLNGVSGPAGQTSVQDLNTALDAIFNHPNLAPFIGKELIQFLTTSNPSPAYISRISAVFNNNGHGVRGDMAAVVTAILLDPEARGSTASSSTFGKLREPAEYAVALMRTLNGVSDGEALINPVSSMGQNLFSAGSVFNFYPPSYPLPNSTLLAPQFGIVNTSTVLNRIGLANTLVYGNPIAPDPTVPGAVGTSLNLGAFEAEAGDANTLVADLNTKMVNGTLSTAEQQTIINAVNSITVSDFNDRAKMAVFLIAVSPRFEIKR
jgi:uncharacterized protein (DUF1800 family)